MGMQVGGGGRDDLNSEINVTPFVDVMLVLLVIFMVTAPMMTTGVDIALPQTTGQTLETAEGKLILSIDRNRRIFLGNTQVAWVDLMIKLQSNERVQMEKELYVEADQTVPYGVVVTAMAMARQAGVAKVMMLTDPAQHLDPTVLDREAGGAEPAMPAGAQ